MTPTTAIPQPERVPSAAAPAPASIPITKPLFGAEELDALREALESGRIVQGAKVAEFERLFAAYTKFNAAVATSSCTSALHLAMVALDVQRGDEVIVPSLTWVATANVVELQGATPVFADIDLDTFNIDPSGIERLITPRTKVIMPVSLFGLSADMPAVVAIARRHGLAVVEDDACALGTFQQGRHAGSLADMACFSFHPRKAITTGEGGMVVTNDAALASAVRSLRDHGASFADAQPAYGGSTFRWPDFDRVGFNYRLTDLQGALGVVQMQRLDAILAGRARVAVNYDRMLSNISWLRPPRPVAGSQHAYQSYVCVYAPETPTLANLERLHKGRNDLMVYLEGKGISTRPGTHAVHTLGYYRSTYGLAIDSCPNAAIAERVSIALPLYPQMTDEEQRAVVDALAAFPQ